MEWPAGPSSTIPLVFACSSITLSTFVTHRQTASRVPSRFFAVIFGISADNRGGKRELQIRAGAGFRVFMELVGI